MSAPGVSDGKWHNVTVTASGSVYFIDYDYSTSQTRDFGIDLSFNSLDIVQMTVSGRAQVPTDSQQING